MHRLLARGPLTAMMASAAVSTPLAQSDWATITVVSDTLGAKVNQLCLGVSSTQSDMIACPSYAPSVTTSGNLIVSGTVSATQFIGDGSLLTGVGASTDRIISGTSRVVVNSATNAISFTTNGVERMVVNSAGNVGIGTSVTDRPLVISSNGNTQPSLESSVRLTGSNGTVGMDLLSTNQYAFIRGGRSAGTEASPGALGSGSTGFTIEHSSYDGVSWTTGSAIRFRASQP